MIDETSVQFTFRGRETAQIQGRGRLRLLHPKVPVGEEGGLVHEQGAGLGKVRSR